MFFVHPQATLSNLEKKLVEERKQKTDFQIKLETERKTKKEVGDRRVTSFYTNSSRSILAYKTGHFILYTGRLRREIGRPDPLRGHQARGRDQDFAQRAIWISREGRHG